MSPGSRDIALPAAPRLPAIDRQPALAAGRIVSGIRGRYGAPTMGAVADVGKRRIYAASRAFFEAGASASYQEWRLEIAVGYQATMY